MRSVNGAVILITGANGGLGAHFVGQALDRGAVKVYATSRTMRTWDDERVVPLPLDVTVSDSIAALVERTSDVTILVNNAGTSGGRRLLSEPLAEVRRVYETNLFGQIALTQALAPALAANGGGAIINVLSALSWFAVPGSYSGTKAAFWSVTNTLRIELLSQGTHVTGAYLGYTDTPMTAALDVPKNDPRDIVEAIYSGLEAGESEVLADETSRQVRAALSLPLTALYPQTEAP